MTDVTYLYGFVAPGFQAPPPDLLGVEGRPVEIQDLDGFAAVVSRLPGDRYGADRVAEHLRDLTWVGQRGLMHERVVTWFVDRGGIVPARLLTLYSSPEALKEEASGSAERVAGDLRRLGSRREWDLKVSYVREDVVRNMGDLSDDVGALDASIARATPGRRYLLERKRDDVAKAGGSAAARRLAQDLLGTLAGKAAEVRELSIPDSGDELPVVLNAAFLLERGQEPAFQQVVQQESERLGSLGLRISFTGPWAPYRFVGGGDG